VATAHAEDLAAEDPLATPPPPAAADSTSDSTSAPLDSTAAPAADSTQSRTYTDRTNEHIALQEPGRPESHAGRGPVIELQIAGTAEEDLRRFIRQEIEGAYPGVLAFGCYVDALVASIEPIVKHAPDTLAVPFQITVPHYFFADSLNLRMRVSSQEKMLRVYADSLLVVEEKVGLGDFWMDDAERERDFTTRGGTYFINRIVRDPWWYPPRWAERDQPVPPGPENPLGPWMAELCKDSTRAGYSFLASKRVTAMRLHGSNTAVNDALVPTHGCVRIRYATQEELCSALLRYCPHDSARVTQRGEIIPLRRPIRIDIVD
jgi:hypothetical protein